MEAGIDHLFCSAWAPGDRHGQQRPVGIGSDGAVLGRGLSWAGRHLVCRSFATPTAILNAFGLSEFACVRNCGGCFESTANTDISRDAGESRFSVV
jgi:hypothetical protein